MFKGPFFGASFLGGPNFGHPYFEDPFWGEPFSGDPFWANLSPRSCPKNGLTRCKASNNNDDDNDNDNDNTKGSWAFYIPSLDPESHKI